MTLLHLTSLSRLTARPLQPSSYPGLPEVRASLSPDTALFSILLKPGLGSRSVPECDSPIVSCESTSYSALYFRYSPYLSSFFQFSDDVGTVTGRGVSLLGSGPSFCRTQGSLRAQQMPSDSSMEEIQTHDTPAPGVFCAWHIEGMVTKK